MSRFRTAFPAGKVFLPVVHVESKEQALRNASIALDNGADGIFLIGHSMSVSGLRSVYEHVRGTLPEAWIGLNQLGLSVEESFLFLPDDVSGIWVDNGLVDPDVPNSIAAARMFWKVLTSVRETPFQTPLYFGGIAFKGQKTVSDPGLAAKLAAPLMDIVTTSGPGTGQAADPEKIALMRKGIEEGILGLASGLTAENVWMYKENVDVFLVATGISDSFTELNPKKTRDFGRNCR
ncbi:MAG: hypothetical protein JWN50_765 [Parcubacteria group bacterium]|nr:hypothetical protein [Parcubacteria group bacterium]